MWYTGFMNVGKLYQTKNYYWLLSPSKEIEVASAAPRVSDATAAVAAASYSKRFNCNVSYISPKSIFLLLEQDGEFIKILSANGEVGWIYLNNFYKDDIKEINQ